MSFHNRICLDIASQFLDIKISAHILRLYMLISGIVTICNGFIVATPLFLTFLAESRQQNNIRYSMQIYSRLEQHQPNNLSHNDFASSVQQQKEQTNSVDHQYL